MQVRYIPRFEIDTVLQPDAALWQAATPETVQGGNAEKGKETYAICAACHGDDGRGIEVLSAPRVAGIPDWYLQRQIKNFDTDIRGTHADDIFGRQMGVIQKIMLKDEQAILDVVAYINTLPKE